MDEETDAVKRFTEKTEAKMRDFIANRNTMIKTVENWKKKQGARAAKEHNQKLKNAKFSPRNLPSNGPEKRVSGYQRAKNQFERLKNQQAIDKSNNLKKKREVQERLEAYKQKKQEKYNKLCKKTKTGQPVMKHRIQMLLEKIESSAQKW